MQIFATYLEDVWLRISEDFAKKILRKGAQFLNFLENF